MEEIIAEQDSEITGDDGNDGCFECPVPGVSPTSLLLIVLTLGAAGGWIMRRRRIG